MNVALDYHVVFVFFEGAQLEVVEYKYRNDQNARSVPYIITYPNTDERVERVRCAGSRRDLLVSGSIKMCRRRKSLSQIAK